MAAPVVDFTAASTPDAAPSSAPYKVSHDATHDEVTYTWEIAFTGFLGYWQERIGGALRTSVTPLRHLGVVCGMNRCGRAGMSMPLKASSSPQSRNRSLEIDDLLLSGDGDYRFGVDALNHAGEWSATT